MKELLVGLTRAASAARVALLAYWRRQPTKLMPVMNKVLVFVVAGMLLGLAPAGNARSVPVNAAGGSNLPAMVDAASVLDGISLDEAVSRAERQYRARVVRTDVQDEDGRKVYVLKLLSEDGRVFTVRIDATTGRSR
jgi:hypothetical protein